MGTFKWINYGSIVVIAIVIVLSFAAYTPRVISGEESLGGCTPCIDDLYTNCGTTEKAKKQGHSCSKETNICIRIPGDLRCYTIRVMSACYFSTWCVRNSFEVCR